MNYSILTDIGRMRSQNQDAVFATEETIGSLPNLFVVADGMGGHKAGEYASSQAIALAKREIASDTGSEPVQIINQGITAANKSIYEEATQDEDKYGMGTTMVAATLLEDHLCVANVGDSRLYVYRDGQLSQITQDHSVVGEMVRKGEMPKEEARSHPKRNLITRAVGAEAEVRVDFFDETLQAGDLVLMCTDGLTSMVEESEIEEVLAGSGQVADKVAKLVDLANDHGGKDNITVIVIEPFSDEV